MGWQPHIRPANTSGLALTLIAVVLMMALLSGSVVEAIATVVGEADHSSA